MRAVPVFDAASPQARGITSLSLAVLAICGAILALIVGLTVYNLIRFRAKPGAPEPRQIFGHKRLEILWTVIPFLLLVWIFVLTVQAMHVSHPPRHGQPDIVVIGHQWWWEVHYPKLGIITANEVHIPTGQALLVRLEAADVIHDFWVPALAPKEDMIPGVTNYIWLQADEPGTYLGACAEFCGAEHAWMRFQVIAQPASQFRAWEADQRRPAPTPPAGAAERGRRLFLDKTCMECHSIRGVAAAGSAGPDLTHLASRRMLGAGVMTNTPPNLSLWLTNPQAIKPGCLMPNLNLTHAQVRDLVSYFQTLK